MLSSRLNLAGKRLVLQTSAHLCLGQQGHDQAWQSWQKVGKVGRLQLPPLDQTLVCALANRGFRLRSQMSHLALSAHRIGKNYEEDWCRSDREASWYLEPLIPKLLQVIKLKKSVVEKVQFSILTNFSLP